MENYRKSIGAIIILLLSTIFVQKANALTLNMEIEPTGNAWQEMRVDCLYAQNLNSWSASNTGNTQWTCNNFPSGATNHSIAGIRTHDTIPIEEGKYYQGFFILRNGSINQPIPQILWNFNQSDDFNFITIEELYDDNSYDTLTWLCSQNGNTTNCNGTQYEQVWNKIYMVTLQAKRTGNARFQVGTNSSLLVAGNNDHNYVFGVRKIVEYQKSGGTAEAEQKTEEATEEGQNNSDSAQSDNQQATSSLLDIAGSIISAFGATSSDCEMSMDLGNVDFGNINFCSGKPSEFSGIIDTVIILTLIPVIFMTVISLINQFINLTKFAQGGE